MAEVLVKRLHKAFPDGTVAVERLDLSIGDGELFVMLGPSGCGKTTTLRCIAGLEEETSGEIVIGDEVVSGLRPSQRDIAMVFQFYALYPHLSVRENMAFPLRAQGRPESEVDERVAEAARMLQLEPFLSRKPSRLSGGEQQRVALGRAMVRQPKAFLMDEPLTNLDAELRADMRAEVKHLQQRLNTTMIYVTHDQTEAMALGDRIAILNKGKLEQIGAPMEVYERPATLFAARFIGSPPMNLIEAEVTNGHLTAAGGMKIAAPEGLERGDRVIAGVRPERFTVTDAAVGEPDSVRGRIVSREALGDETIYVVDTEAGLLHVRMPPTARFDEDQNVAVRHQGAAPPAYDPQTEQVVSR
jgi:multiple sugar transport system ATP-binding protein